MAPLLTTGFSVRGLPGPLRCVRKRGAPRVWFAEGQSAEEIALARSLPSPILTLTPRSKEKHKKSLTFRAQRMKFVFPTPAGSEAAQGEDHDRKELPHGGDLPNISTGMRAAGTYPTWLRINRPHLAYAEIVLPEHIPSGPETFRKEKCLTQ